MTWWESRAPKRSIRRLRSPPSNAHFLSRARRPVGVIFTPATQLAHFYGRGVSSLGGESRDDECFADDLYCDGRIPNPQSDVFRTRPPSFMPQGESHDVGSRPNTASMDTSVALHSQMVGGYGRQGAMLKRSWVGSGTRRISRKSSPSYDS
ncbi:hypothetical protein B0H13DRAFT_1903872 [Mycena leptocephala]|nr:hypothetical protein B0H13DRAFT_1903872 [Mycena leptocephala]